MKSYTDLEQSKKLAEILPIESADMCYLSEESLVPKVIYNGMVFFNSEEERPTNVIHCWSLAALLELLPKRIEIVDNVYELSIYLYGIYYWNINNGNLCFESKDKDNFVDACYEAIVFLHEQKTFVIMDYKEKYEQALEVAQKLYQDCPNGKNDRLYHTTDLEKMFPELRESEDEKIRKELIEHVKDQQSSFISAPDCRDKYEEEENNKYNAWIAWLEKQGTPNQTSIWKHWKDGIAGNGEGELIYLVKDSNTYSLNSCLSFECDYIELSELDKLLSEKQSGQKLADKVEPKFHKGEWINGYYTNYNVLSVNNDGYVVEDVDGNKINILFENEKFHHLFNIADAKDGDGLADDRAILLFRSIGNRNWKNVISYYAILETNLNNRFSISDDEKYWGKVEDCELKPASKEQRYLLFSKMKEAGYEWDAEKKELRKIGQTPVWSEEDERNMKEIILFCDTIASGAMYSISGERLKSISQTLKSLKYRVQPQPKQEWSEEDSNILNGIIAYLSCNACGLEGFDKWYDWLKSLSPQPKQEWSQNDIDMIDWLICCCEKEHEELCNDKYGHQDIVSDLKRDCRKKWDWLESLKNRVAPQNTWKPSKEQIIALRWVLNNVPYNKHKEEISGLLDQIKDL